MPILDGAPGFILLAFIMALAAYLRQVSAGAQKLIDELQGGIPTSFPYQRAAPAIREEKTRFLLEMRARLAAVTQVFFLMLTLLAVRMIFLAVARLGFIQAFPHDLVRLWFDLVYVIAVFVVIVAMWVMHTSARRRDEEIREKAVASQAVPSEVKP